MKSMTNEFENTCCENIFDHGRFELENGEIIDQFGEIPPIKLDSNTPDGSEPYTVDGRTLLHFLNKTFSVDIPIGEIAKEAIEEDEPKMTVFNEYDFQNTLFNAAINFIRNAPKGFVYVVFGMGSVKLDISNPQNALEVNKDYVEIFNAENGEVTMLKTTEITGFVFEPKITELEDIEEDIDHADD